MTEAEAPSAGHNGLTEGEKQAIFLHRIANIERLEGEKKDIADAIKEEKEAIRTQGYTNAQIKYALDLRKNDDAEMLEKRRREAQVARFLGHPIGTQSDIFDEIDRTPAVDKAFEEGRIAGAEGKNASPPYDQSTEQGQQWLKGWHEGQADLASGFKKLEAGMPDDVDQVDLEDAA